MSPISKSVARIVIITVPTETDSLTEASYMPEADSNTGEWSLASTTFTWSVVVAVDGWEDVSIAMTRK